MASEADVDRLPAGQYLRQQWALLLGQIEGGGLTDEERRSLLDHIRRSVIERYDQVTEQIQARRTPPTGFDPP